jgi:hypothetical protein
MTMTGTLLLSLADVGNTSPVPMSSPVGESNSSSTPASASVRSEKIIYAKPTDFFCDLRDQKDETGKVIRRNVPTTLAKVDLAQALRQIPSSQNSVIQLNNRKDQDVVVYYWTQDYSDSQLGETALMRCRRVASVLQEIKSGNSLNLIKVGKMNGGNAVCLSSKVDGSCTRLIFPLKTIGQLTEATDVVLKDFLEAMKGLPIAKETIVAVKAPSPVLESTSSSTLVRRRYEILQQQPDGISPTRRKGGALR